MCSKEFSEKNKNSIIQQFFLFKKNLDALRCDFQANPDERGVGDCTFVAESGISKSTDGGSIGLYVRTFRFHNYPMNEERLMDAGRPSLAPKSNLKNGREVRTPRSPPLYPPLFWSNFLWEGGSNSPIPSPVSAPVLVQFSVVKYSHL
jgi:hypothetical protein